MMGHPWKDGNFKIYIIKHLYKDEIERGWGGSGSCEQFYLKDVVRRHFDKRFKNIFRPFTASGNCWQKLEYMVHLLREMLLKSLIKFLNGILNIDSRYVDYY